MTAPQTDLALQRYLPRRVVTERRRRFLRWLTRAPWMSYFSATELHNVSTHASVQLFRPAGLPSPSSALLWIHGGGYMIGGPLQDASFCWHVARTLGILVASVDYRLAPEHPFPAPLEDCHDSLLWLASHAGVDPQRIVVGGASAGGGLAAALTQLACHRRSVRPALQLLVYPMLDDRTAWRPPPELPGLRVWDHASIVLGWSSYLGHHAPEVVPRFAAPARETALSNLPSAWIGVGDQDLFFAEDRDYAARLREAGVDVDLLVVPGGYHGFDVAERRSQTTRHFVDAQLRAIASALGLPEPTA